MPPALGIPSICVATLRDSVAGDARRRERTPGQAGNLASGSRRALVPEPVVVRGVPSAGVELTAGPMTAVWAAEAADLRAERAGRATRRAR